MRDLLKNIWEGPGTTFAAAIAGAAAVFADAEYIPQVVRLGLGAASVFLLFYGPNKPTKK